MTREKIEVSDGILISGGFADVRFGRYMGNPVAVKTLKIAVQDDLQKIRKVSVSDNFFPAWDTVSTTLLQQFCQEVILWRALSHPNILKLIGVQWDMEERQFSTVSEWMEHGNIMEYIKTNSVNRLELVRDFTSPVHFFR